MIMLITQPKYPQLFKKKKYSNIILKAKKIKTPELASLGVHKTTALNLRKLSVAEVTKERIRQKACKRKKNGFSSSMF